MEALEQGGWGWPRSLGAGGAVAALAALLDGGGRARASRLLTRHAGLGGLTRALASRRAEVSEVERRRLLAALDLGLSWATEARPTAALDRPERIAECCARLVQLDSEALVVLGLDAGRRLRGRHVIGGGQTGVRAAPADLLRPALAMGANSLALVHNHPSGDPTPSALDVRFTGRVRRAAELCGIELVDHVVVAREGWRSLRAGGWS